MEDTVEGSTKDDQNISINNANLSDKESKNINKKCIIENKNSMVCSDNIFKTALEIKLILNQIFQFLKRDDIKSLSLCNRKMYKLYCEQIIKIKINRINANINIVKILDNYPYINNLDLSECSDLTSISFLEKNNNIKELRLNSCKNIKDFSIISKLKKLESLDVDYTNISDISFLEKNNNIKELRLNSCKNINDFSSISKLE